MKQRGSSRQRRSAFTLIELLVVMAIIGILISLISAAVMKFLGLGPKTQTSAEIGQMQDAIGQFKQKYGVKYVPSRFLLCETIPDYNSFIQGGGPNGALADESLRFLRTMFTEDVGIRYDATTQQKSFLHMDWNADGQVSQAALLEGQQCLVFFLGGVQKQEADGTLGVLGFSTNKRNPAEQGGTRVRPFEFQPARIRRGRNAQSLGYFEYLDGWEEQPYAFFSASGGNENAYRDSDCASLGLTTPYFQTLNNFGKAYHKPTSYQIISAGADKVFGTGGQFNEDGTINVSPGDIDNVTNFHSGKMD